MKSTNPIKQLQCLNKILGLATGSDPYFSEQIEQALHFQSRTHPESLKSEYNIAKPAATLLQVHLKDKSSSIPSHHWHLDTVDMGPLWLSAKLEEILTSFKDVPQALLVITGLRSYVCPQGKRWSPKAQQQYEETLTLIQKDSAKWVSSKTQLHLICL